MHQPGHTNWHPSGSAAFWTLAAWLAFGPGPANGSCGDYLRHGPPAPLAVDLLSRVKDPLGQPSVPIPRCSGPACSQSPMNPPTSPLRPSRDLEPWAHHVAQDAPSFLDVSHLLVPSCALHPIQRTSDVFHPPR